jgi:hypothetical protein
MVWELTNYSCSRRARLNDPPHTPFPSESFRYLAFHEFNGSDAVPTSICLQLSHYHYLILAERWICGET